MWQMTYSHYLHIFDGVVTNTTTASYKYNHNYYYNYYTVR